MKAFNLEEAKAGKPVCTRDGRPARILCFDKEGIYPIVALITQGSEESVNCYQAEGLAFHGEKTGSDLMMADVKKKGWINVYKGSNTYYERIYNTKEEALSERSELNYVTTTEIEWEE